MKNYISIRGWWKLGFLFPHSSSRTPGLRKAVTIRFWREAGRAHHPQPPFHPRRSARNCLRPYPRCYFSGSERSCSSAAYLFLCLKSRTFLLLFFFLLYLFIFPSHVSLALFQLPSSLLLLPSSHPSILSFLISVFFPYRLNFSVTFLLPFQFLFTSLFTSVPSSISSSFLSWAVLFLCFTSCWISLVKWVWTQPIYPTHVFVTRSVMY